MFPRMRLAAIATVLAAIFIAATYFLTAPVANSDALLAEARLLLKKGDHQKAEDLARRASSCADPSAWALLVAAEAALKTNRYSDALGYYEHVPRHSTAARESADFGEAEMLCHLGRLSDSEARLRQLLARDPFHKLAHYRLAFLLNITGRRWEAQPHLLFLIKNRAAEIEHLLLLGNSQRQVEDQALLESAARLFPQDPLPKLGAARLEMTLNQLEKARPLFEAVLSVRPREPEATVGLGQLLLDDADHPDRFISWSADLAQELERHPEVWMLRGQFARRNHQPETAARCFWEALQRDPDHLGACHQLGRSLTELNDAERAIPFLKRAELLQRLSSALDDLFHHRDHLESMRRAALLTRELGRMWEAASWSSIAMSIDPGLLWALEILQEVSPQLSPDLPQTAPAFDLSRQVNVASFPLPNWAKVPRTFAASTTSEAIPKAIQFQNDAQPAGIDFRYENGADHATPGARIFETTGGGVGVIDYDGDGWPDLYLTQGGQDPNRSNRSATDLTDRIFRNHAGERFEDVTCRARLGDPDFSQGVSVGDFNNDGFPDLYVANLGQNRLYVNQGDGTFDDVTDQAGVRDSQWTTSCLMADLNDDGFSDLYDVNYAGGEQLLSLLCQKQGVTRSCSPRAFDAAPDRIWLNQGDGLFRDASRKSGIDIPGGYGLGIVALDLEGRGRLSLFVANDEVPNFLFENDLSTSDSVHFAERGLLAGVALDANGKAQACMGVAAGDADGDGLIDLLVTNFYRESSTLYRQVIRGQFADVTRASGLRDPSFNMLGFGTQFLDADLDGSEDLVVTNGHIDDLTSIGEPYKMPTQFFRNVGHGRFIELPSASLGPFFQETHLGRGLARLDWNRDGLDDFAVSLIGEPAGLLTNQTPAPGHFLAIQVRGTLSSRDGIGTSVEITVGDQRFSKQLTAGDGYQASNERQLRFGLGTNDHVEKLVVRWPHGSVQEWHGVAANQTILLIEGSPRWWTIYVSPKP
jgi:tetratricopeptide (TPR) repeat protein